MSTLPPCFAILIAWYCIRGLLPISPRTSTWTEILGSSTDAEATAFGGECLKYRLGKQRRITVKIVEAIVASVKRISNMATWLQNFSLTGCVLERALQIISTYSTSFSSFVDKKGGGSDWNGDYKETEICIYIYKSLQGRFRTPDLMRPRRPPLSPKID